MEWLGQRSHEEVLDLLGAATVLVFPSTSYETFGLVLIEAFARGTPLIAARAGGTAEIVEEGKSGLLFKPGDAGELAGSLSRMLESPSTYPHMRLEARQRYEREYTADANHDRLLEIYRSAMQG
ncbi:MAG: glycosyltransferase [Thioalkalivibrio sp.]|nr:glycosyltransferase [Thioalkalivibrio sp.]